MEDTLMVSINCTTFNHENYIADAIESFLMQKTDFAYEILIHDDASTDSTPEIIRQYEHKYPDLIKPIYQTENQYSKGIKVSGFNNERARGKYIAICEGDDYWTDPCKLQKQVDWMEGHPECSLCVHAAYRVNSDKTRRSHIRPNIGDKVFPIEEVIRGGGGLFATNSILYPTIYAKDRPEFYRKSPAGDYPLVIYLALQGKVYYIDKFMSAYRYGVPGSWTSRVKSDKEQMALVYKRLVNMLDEINRYTGYKYAAVIHRTIRDMKIKRLIKYHFPNTARAITKIKLRCMK